MTSAATLGRAVPKTEDGGGRVGAMLACQQRSLIKNKSLKQKLIKYVLMCKTKNV